MKERLWILLAKKATREITEDELAEMEQLLRASGEVTFTSDLMERLWEVPLLSPQTRESEENNWQAISAHMNVRDEKVRTLHAGRRWAWAAAAVVLLCAAGATGYWWARRAPDPIPEANVVTTRPDSRSMVTLPDGSTVWLNSASKIAYNKDYGEHRRDVTLTGEAYFDVTHDPKMPLVVHARGVAIVVLGTAFNVRAYEKDSGVTTSLVQGMVALTDSARPGWRMVLQAHQKLTIANANKAGDKKAISEALQLQAEPVSGLIPEVSWVDNKLAFYKEPFSSLAERLSRWYRVQIRIEDPQLEKVTFTGVFYKESLTQALSALQVSCRFHFVKEGDLVSITR